MTDEKDNTEHPNEKTPPSWVPDSIPECLRTHPAVFVGGKARERCRRLFTDTEEDVNKVWKTLSSAPLRDGCERETALSEYLTAAVTFDWFYLVGEEHAPTKGEWKARYTRIAELTHRLRNEIDDSVMQDLAALMTHMAENGPHRSDARNYLSRVKELNCFCTLPVMLSAFQKSAELASRFHPDSLFGHRNANAVPRYLVRKLKEVVHVHYDPEHRRDYCFHEVIAITVNVVMDHKTSVSAENVRKA